MEGRSPSQLSVEIAQHSDPGRDPNKQVNEDSCGYAHTKFGHLCVLCDGMGGHYGGQEASRRAITTIFEQIEKAPAHLTPAAALKLAIEEAARRVYELGGPPDNKVRPGSTVVSMLLHDGGVDVAHVGDSRAYVVRANQIYPLTRDHSMVQSMIDAGFLTEEQAIGHPDANKITRALGMKPEVDVEVRPDPMELFTGDVLLQSSDGLTDLALGHEILAAVRQALNAGNVEYCCQQLVRMANDRGGHDNITVQMARVLKTAPKQTRSGHTHAPEVGQHQAQPMVGGGAMAGGMAGNPMASTAASGPHPAAPHPGLATVPDGGPKFTASDFTPHGQPHADMPPESMRAKPTIPMHGPGAQAPQHAQAHAAMSSTVPASPIQQHAAQIMAAQPHGGQQWPGQQAGAAVSPTLGPGSMLTPTPQAALAGYRMDAPGGLAPPPSGRFAPQATPPMTPTPGAYQQNQPVAWDSSLPSGPPSMGNRNVLFLWMGVAFMAAAAFLIVIWALFWR